MDCKIYLRKSLKNIGPDHIINNYEKIGFNISPEKLINFESKIQSIFKEKSNIYNIVDKLKIMNVLKIRN